MANMKKRNYYISMTRAISSGGCVIRSLYDSNHVDNWPAQPGDPSAIRGASVIGFSVLYYLLSVLYLFSVC